MASPCHGTRPHAGLRELKKKKKKKKSDDSKEEQTPLNIIVSMVVLK